MKISSETLRTTRSSNTFLGNCTLSLSPYNTRKRIFSRGGIVVLQKWGGIAPSLKNLEFPSLSASPPTYTYSRRSQECVVLYLYICIPLSRLCPSPSTKRDCCYVALGDQQVSSSLCSSSSSALTRLLLILNAFDSLSLSLSLPPLRRRITMLLLAGTSRPLLLWSL